MINRRLIQILRWVLMLGCVCSGAFLLLWGESKGFGILLLLIGLWLAFDNPLEYFEILEIPCPYCNSRVRVRRSIEMHCPECLSAIVKGSESIVDENEAAVPLQRSKALAATAEEHLKVEPAKISPGDTLDLHTFLPEEVPSLLDEFIDLALKADITLARIIHGKGSGTLRRRVHGLLARDPRVVSFRDAPPKSGGWGATLVELKPDRVNNGGKGGRQQE